MNDQGTKLSISTGTFIRFWLVIIGFMLAIAGIFLARDSLIMLAISFFLAVVLNRPVSFLAKYVPGHSRALATLAAYLFVIMIIGVLFFSVIPVFVYQFSTFIGNAPQLIDELQVRNNDIEVFFDNYGFANQYNVWLGNISDELGNLANQVSGSVIGMLTIFANIIVKVVFVAVLTFLLLVEGPDWEKKFWAVVYKNPAKRAHHQKIAKKMYDVVGGYMAGQTMVAAIGGTLTAIVVWLLSLAFPIDSSLILPSWMAIFLMAYVPMFGATIGGFIVTALLLLFSWPAATIYLVYFIIQQQVENNYISPKIQSKRLNISALVVLVSVMIGLNVGGIFGALIAIPTAGCLLVILREFLDTRRKQSNNNNPKSSNSQKSSANNNVINGDVSIVFVEHDSKFSKPELRELVKKLSLKKK